MKALKELEYPVLGIHTGSNTTWLVVYKTVADLVLGTSDQAQLLLNTQSRLIDSSGGSYTIDKAIQLSTRSLSQRFRGMHEFDIQLAEAWNKLDIDAFKETLASLLASDLTLIPVKKNSRSFILHQIGRSPAIKEVIGLFQ